MPVARVALPVAAPTPFDYWVPDGLAAGRGALVRVRLAGRLLTGVVVEVPDRSEIPRERLQPIAAVLHELPVLPVDLLDLASFVASYYQEPLGLVIAQMIPPLRTTRRSAARFGEPAAPLRLTDSGRTPLGATLQRAPRLRALYAGWHTAPDSILTVEAQAALSPYLRNAVKRWLAGGFVERVSSSDTGTNSPGTLATPAARLNEDQRRALAAIPLARHEFAPFLLQGVTGSGKTEVYLAAAAAVIAAGGQALILVPEINLTPQFLHRIADTLPGRKAVMLHSRVSASERLQSWKAAAAGEIDVVLGTRLAVFTPLPRLALIVVDEEHDPSFKQQDGVRYHGRDVAVWRARQREVPILLGSATPALETLVQAQRGRYGWLKLPQRAVAPAGPPRVVFVPNRDVHTLEGMSTLLLSAIELRLGRGEQALVFINRRGFAPSLLCGSCGWQAGCPRCSARLVVHRDARMLRCHHCGHAERLPAACPGCGNVDLLPVGHGTQRLERALAARFPGARIARIDRDSTRKRGAFAAVRDQMHAGEVDILVGTQMLAKGHDFPRLTLVGVLGADNALYSADFRATERLAALLFQVSGRAGRRDLPGEVIVQTDFPTHPLARALARHDYDSLAEVLLAERRAAMLPPFAHLALLVAEAPHRDAVDAFLAAASDAGRNVAREQAIDVEVFPPVPAALPRRAGLERAQVLAQAVERRTMQRFLPHWRDAIDSLPGRRVRFSLDVDPLGFA
jgi:primosomal protein N' (replication factor Y) (superfamily II helicase)